MKVLLLAAGRGTRISRRLGGKPKCLVNLGNQTLIEYTIELLKKNGISDIAIVLGYESKLIMSILKKYNIKFFYNPFFDVTNSISSAWFAKEFINEDDMLIMNADVFVEEKLMKYILQYEESPVMFADSSRKLEADYKFKYENGILLKYGKELEGEDISGEYIGIGKFKKDFIGLFTNKLDEKIKKQEHNLWWENVVYDISNSIDIKVEDIKGSFWAEVDYIEDYERIMKYIEGKL